jgi:hypothetical protein
MVSDFKWVANGGLALVEDQASWAGETTFLANGFPTGIVDPLKFNKAYRQATGPGAAIAQAISQILGEDVLDDGVLANFERQFWETTLRAGYFVDAGSANTLLTVNPAGVAFPAPKDGEKVRIKVAATNNSTVVNYNHFGNGNHPVTYSDGNPPGVGDLPGGGVVELIYDATNTRWQISSFSIAALRGLGTLINVQQFVTSTRVSLVGNAGNSWTATAWSGINYIKKSATSQLIAWISGTTYCAGATAPSGIILTIGGQAFPAVASNNFSGTNTGPSTLYDIFSGLGAGSLAVSLAYKRNDSTDWTDIFCPTNADNAYLATTNPAVLIVGELGQ